MKYGFIITLLLFTAACAQDPLEDQPENVRNGVPPLTQVTGEPIPRDFFHLEVAPEVPVFYEGEVGSFVLEGRITDKADLPVTITVNNLPTGAKFDEATGTVTWQPEFGLLSAGESSKLIPFTATISTDELGVATSVVENFHLWIHKRIVKPEIVNFKATKGTSLYRILEGSKIDITVEVKSVYETIAPKLRFYGPNNHLNGVTFMESVGNPTFNATTKLWEYTYILNTQNKNLTVSSKNYGVELEALDNSGDTSITKSLSFKVVTKVGEPKTTWVKDVFVRAGEVSEFRFQIYVEFNNFKSSPTSSVVPNAEINFDKSSQINNFCSDFDQKFKGSLECKCLITNGSSWQPTTFTCSIKTKPDVGDIGEYVVKIPVTSENTVMSTDKEKLTIEKKIIVSRNVEHEEEVKKLKELEEAAAKLEKTVADLKAEIEKKVQEIIELEKKLKDAKSDPETEEEMRKRIREEVRKEILEELLGGGSKNTDDKDDDDSDKEEETETPE